MIRDCSGPVNGGGSVTTGVGATVAAGVVGSAATVIGALFTASTAVTPAPISTTSRTTPAIPARSRPPDRRGATGADGTGVADGTGAAPGTFGSGRPGMGAVIGPPAGRRWARSWHGP